MSIVSSTACETGALTAAGLNSGTLTSLQRHARAFRHQRKPILVDVDGAPERFGAPADLPVEMKAQGAVEHVARRQVEPVPSGGFPDPLAERVHTLFLPLRGPGPTLPPFLEVRQLPRPVDDLRMMVDAKH